MPRLRPIGRFSVVDPHHAYGFQVQPGFQGTDRVSDLGFVNCYEAERICYDAVAKCVYAEPMFVPHHNLRTKWECLGWVTTPGIGEGQMPALERLPYNEEEPRPGLPDYPEIKWDLVSKSAQTDFVSTIFAPLKYTGLRAQLTPGKEHDPNGLLFSTTCDEVPAGTRGFYCFKRLSAGTDEIDADKYRSIRFEFYVSDDLHWEVDYNSGTGLRLREFNGTQIRTVGTMNSTQSYAEVVGHETYLKEQHGPFAPVVHADQTCLVVLLVNGLLQFWVHGQAQPLVIKCPDYDEFTKVKVVGHGGRYAFFSVHPMCFASSAYLVANEKQLGFVRMPETPISYIVHNASALPSGCSASASTEWEQGSEFRYRLQLTNAKAGTYKGIDYSRKTGSVKGVTYRIAPYAAFRNVETWAIFDAIRSAQIKIAFDIRSLNIASQATIVVNNRHGEWRDGWAYGNGRGKGNRAITIDLGWQDLDTGYWWMNRRFTGMGGIEMAYSRGPAPESTVAITCEDLSIRCREYPLMACPWMDGWCHLYAIRFLAWLAGVTDAQMDFEYCNDPYCSNPDHYHLPMGEGGNPRTYFGPGTSVWDAMNRIRRWTGHVLYFDVWGRLRYYPWIRTQPGPAKRIFYDGPSPSMDPLQSIEQAQFTRSTRTVRTGITVVGVDAYGPAWKPIISHRANNDALYNLESANFKGFRAPAAIADPMFAKSDYASEVADNLAAVVSLPSETLNLSMLGMGDLYPLDVIGIYDRKMPTNVGALWKAFFLTQTVENFVQTKGPASYRMGLQGRWIV